MIAAIFVNKIDRSISAGACACARECACACVCLQIRRQVSYFVDYQQLESEGVRAHLLLLDAAGALPHVIVSKNDVIGAGMPALARIVVPQIQTAATIRLLV